MTQLFVEGKAMSTDLISQTIQLLGYLLLLVVLTTLWINVSRQPVLRRFWILLALAWTMNLLGNIAWIVHDFVTNSPLDTLSGIDLFYVAHYGLVAAALWLYPASLPRRAGLWIGVVMLAVNAIVWAIYYPPIMALKSGPWTSFLGYAMYPVLDAGLVTLAFLRYHATRRSTWAGTGLLLFCAMTSYGLANTLNLTGYAFSLFADGILPNLLWILANVFVLAMALGLKQKTKNLSRE